MILIKCEKYEIFISGGPHLSKMLLVEKIWQPLQVKGTLDPASAKPL